MYAIWLTMPFLGPRNAPDRRTISVCSVYGTGWCGISSRAESAVPAAKRPTQKSWTRG
jgi:hypothetical protein